MSRRFFDLAFTPAVEAEQARRGSRDRYAAATANTESHSSQEMLGKREIGFIEARDSFYLASVSETGWPYVQHRGGPVGFVRALDKRSIGWAEYSGNSQYVSAGNLRGNDRVALIFTDYAHQRRLKILGHARAYDTVERSDLAHALGAKHEDTTIEQFLVVTVEAFDWNCPQHITPRFTLAEIEDRLVTQRENRGVRSAAGRE
jgi:predicted pyridoxine 5'-phosphate oxidase superfamily flavin-nucleotide-binding protein